MSDQKVTSNQTAKKPNEKLKAHVPAVYVNKPARELEKTMSLGHAELGVPTASVGGGAATEEEKDHEKEKAVIKKSEIKDKATLLLKAIRSEIRPLRIKENLRTLQLRIRKIV